MALTVDELIRKYRLKPGEGSRLRRAARIEALWRLGRADATRGAPQLARAHFRDAMEYDAYVNGFATLRANPLRRTPGKKRHSASWDRCVEEIRRKRGNVNPYAVCTASLRELAYRNPVRDREHRRILARLKHHFESDERMERRRRKR